MGCLCCPIEVMLWAFWERTERVPWPACGCTGLCREIALRECNLNGETQEVVPCECIGDEATVGARREQKEQKV